MSSIFAKKLDIWVWKTEVGAQKINDSSLIMLKMVIKSFSIDDKANRPLFFEETFFIANISMDNTLRILFLIFSNIEINFLERKFNWGLYTIIEALSTTKQIELIRKKEFAATVFDPNNETFVIYIIFFNSTNVHLSYKAQIVLLIQDNCLREVPSEYAYFTHIFFFNLVTKLSEHIEVNNHFIDLVKS